MADAGFAEGFSVVNHCIGRPEYVQTAEVIREQLKAINIDMEVVPEEIGTFGAHNNEGDYDFAGTGRGMGPDPGSFVVNQARPLSTKWFTQDGETATWKNDELSTLYEEALVALDHETRVGHFKRMQEIILDEVPQVWLVQPYRFAAVRSYVKDYFVSYTGPFRPCMRSVWLET
jgi:peptide/nickel transport system substrate-binding protein